MDMIGDHSIVNIIIAAIAGAGSLAAYSKFKRPTLMSSESRAEFKEIYTKKQDVSTCQLQVEHMGDSLTRLETGQEEIKKDIKSILKGMNGIKN